jgi:preprotein translocase subunit YajC
MLISEALASSEAMDAPSDGELFIYKLLPILFVCLAFYLLLILPQQRRFKEHKTMLDSLKKGDKVITAGGLVGKVDKLIDDIEVLVDLGNGVKVTALRSTIQTRMDDTK